MLRTVYVMRLCKGTILGKVGEALPRRRVRHTLIQYDATPDGSVYVTAAHMTLSSFFGPRKAATAPMTISWLSWTTDASLCTEESPFVLF